MSEESKTKRRMRPVKAADGEILAEDAKASRQVWWFVGAAVFLVLVLAGLAGAQWKYAWVDSWPHASNEAAFTFSQQPPAALVAAPAPKASVNVAAVSRALEPYLTGKAKTALGSHVDVWVAGLHGAAYSNGNDPITPASIIKLLTTTAALDVLGPQHRFTTSVRLAGPATIALVGGGDAYLTETPSKTYPSGANLTALAAQTAVALKAKGLTNVTVNYDASLFAEPGLSPEWEANYFPDGIIAPISALWVDEGKQRDGSTAANPARAAARTFADLLTKQGITVSPTSDAVNAGSAPVLAEALSATLVNQVAYVLAQSDNFGAEVLARQVAVATGQPATFDGAVAGIKATLSKLGVALAGLTMYDGSGLSRHDRLIPDTLGSVFRLAATNPRISGIITGLPVAGFDGTLGYRFTTTAPQALGVVRAKTGTLTGVHSMAGIAIDADGNPLIYVAIADQVPVALTGKARDVLDDIGAALSACRCTVSP